MQLTRIRTIDQLNSFFHQHTFHPLVTVCRLEDADKSFFRKMQFDMYCVILMDVEFGEFVKADTTMRYKAGTIITTKPGDTVGMRLDHNVKPRGIILAFHPQMIANTGLGRDFYMFNFFEYKVQEALELNESERRVIQNCYANIDAELRTPDDELTGHMLRLGIGQLLSYCKRFYERQFDTKNLKVSDFMRKLDALLDSYYAPKSTLPRLLGQPTVKWCSEQFHLSPNYFGDVVRHELRITAQDYIQRKTIERAKSLLADMNMSISEVADTLGFSYPNHFTRFFKNKAGQSPNQFRKSLKS